MKHRVVAEALRSLLCISL